MDPGVVQTGVVAEIIESNLPGVGLRHELLCESGDRVGLITRHSGRRDLLVFDRADLVCSRLQPAKSAVYCGRSHPLWRTPDASTRAILRHPFAAPVTSPGGAPVDGWPAHLERTVSLRASMLEPAIDACVRGELLAVLPLEVIDGLGSGARVRKLEGIRIPDTEIFLVRLRPLGPHPNAAKVFAATLA